jgi:hypothetical protein
MCTSTGSGFVVQGSATSQVQFQNPGTTLRSGLFTGLQYWQASIVMQLMICAVALALSAFLLPPIRRFHLRRRRIVAPAPA